MNKKSLFIAILCVLCSFSAKAQFDFQARWAFEKGSQHPTVQLNYNHDDRVGSTYIRTIFDINSRDNINIIESPSLAFLNVERELCFWNKVDLWNRLNVHLGYQGGLLNNGAINNAVTAGLSFKIFDDENRELDFKVMYRYAINAVQLVPLQVSSKFCFTEVLDVTGLTIEGYANLLWQDHVVTHNPKLEALEHPRNSHIMLNIAPQIWYNVGQFINLDQLNVGGEVRINYDYAHVHGLYCLPSAGVKWVF